MKRNCRFEVRLSKSEFEGLSKKAKKAGLSAGAFVRKAIAGTEVREAPDADVGRLIMEILCKYPASVKRVSQFLREDIVKMEKLDAETLLLGKEQISTMEELLRYKQGLQSKLNTAEQQRRDLRNLERSYSRKHDPEKAEACSVQAAELTKEIKKLRKDIDLCDDIALRSAQTREELEWIIEQQEQNRETESDAQRDEKADRQR